MTKADPISENKNLAFLKKLIGLRLDAVIFIMDYLQLQMESALLTIVTSPTVVSNDVRRLWGELGFRDSLCHLICHKIASIEFEEGEKLVLRFDNNANLEIGLVPDFPEGAECLIIQFDKEWTVL